MKTLLTTTALVALLAAVPAFAQSESAPVTEMPAATDTMPADQIAPDAQPPAAAEDTMPAVDPAPDTASEPALAPTTPDTAETPAVEPAPAVAATDGELFIGQQADEENLASNWIGESVYNAADENLGEVNDLVISSDGILHAAIIGVGGFLGMGEKNVAVSVSAIEPRTDENGNVTLYIQATQEQLDAAPEFKTLADLRAERQAAQPITGPDAAAPGAMAPVEPAPAQ